MENRKFSRWRNWIVATAFCFFATVAFAESKLVNDDFSSFVSFVAHRQPSNPAVIVDALHKMGIGKVVRVNRLQNQTNLTTDGDFRFHGEIAIRSISMNYYPGLNKIAWTGFVVAPNICLSLRWLYQRYGKFEFGPVSYDAAPLVAMHKVMPWGEYVALYRAGREDSKCVADFRVVFNR